MRYLWTLGLAYGLSMPAGADPVFYDVVTTFDALASTCQSVQFGPDAAGLDRQYGRSAVAPYTAVLMMVRVTRSWTSSSEGNPVAKVPQHLQMPIGSALVLLEGKADAICPQLRQPQVRMRLLQSDCDAVPREGRCLIPHPIRRVELAD